MNPVPLVATANTTPLSVLPPLIVVPIATGFACFGTLLGSVSRISGRLPTANARGLDRPKTFNGLMLCYSDGIPFYKTSLLATLVFSAILFGTYAFIRNYRAVGKEIKAS